VHSKVRTTSKREAERVGNIHDKTSAFAQAALLCPHCGGQMSIIAFIENHAVVDKIINHLKLHFIAERPPLPTGPSTTLHGSRGERRVFLSSGN